MRTVTTRGLFLFILSQKKKGTDLDLSATQVDIDEDEESFSASHRPADAGREHKSRAREVRRRRESVPTTEFDIAMDDSSTDSASVPEPPPSVVGFEHESTRCSWQTTSIELAR